MKKETINTFSEGMIMDLHPLTTPSNVLTNCLNGTTITYNGNEFVLQNDMGNGEVHTAYLDTGYVPIGMKEHGGIIYVVAHNPITGRSQIGSFPSPQQLYTGDDLNITSLKLDFTNLITPVKVEGTPTYIIPYITTEYYKQKLFQIESSDKTKIFHPGDKFILTSAKISKDILTAIKDGVLKLRLGVLNSSGSIDYIDNSTLKIYDNKLWLHELRSEEEVETVLKDNSLVQVFSAKSSGSLMLLVEFKPFDTFNLIRKYSYNAKNKLQVSFIGDTTGVYTGKTTDKDSKVQLILDTDTVPSQPLGEYTIVDPGADSTVSYKLLPCSPYGAVERLSKTGIINFNDIRNNSQKFSEWRFYVTENYLKIGWGYDYYNIDEESNIDRIEFVFINLEDSAIVDTLPEDSTAGIANSLMGDYNYKLNKDYYNGSFEEIIQFSDSTIRKNWIYVVRIDRYIKGEKQVIGYRLVYTSSYFNKYYASVPDFSTGVDIDGNQMIQIDGYRKPIPIECTIETTVDKKLTNISIANKIHIDATDTGGWKYDIVPKPSDYVKVIPNDTKPNYIYNTRKSGKYTFTAKAVAGFKYNKKELAGIPEDAFISTIFDGAKYKYTDADHSDIAYNNNSDLKIQIQNIYDSVDSIGITHIGEGEITLTSNILTSRNIYSNTGNVESRAYDSERLLPVYSSDMSPIERDKLFAFKEVDNVTYCVTGGYGEICYNSRITGSPNTEDPYRGIHAGAGADEDGLKTALLLMGNGTVGIFGGHNGDHASLRYEGTTYADGAWHTKKQEVDGGANFMLATWKDKFGTPRVVNIGSQKDAPNDVTSPTTLIRLEKMLKCFLSQLLVAKRDMRTVYFVGSNSNNFVYHTSFDTKRELTLNMASGGTEIPVEFKLSTDSKKSIENYMALWQKTYVEELINFLPTFKATKPTKVTFPIVYGKEIRFDNDSNILSCYTSAYSSFTTDSSKALDDTQRKSVYVIDRDTYVKTNKDGSLEFEKKDDGEYTISSISNQIILWRGKTDVVDLHYSIDSVFITAYKHEGRTGALPEGYYNELFIEPPKDQNHTRIGKWVHNTHDDHAPDMFPFVGLGKRSIFNYW